MADMLKCGKVSMKLPSTESMNFKACFLSKILYHMLTLDGVDSSNNRYLLTIMLISLLQIHVMLSTYFYTKLLWKKN